MFCIRLSSRVGLLVLTLVTSSACGASPLFNHDDAQTARQNDAPKPIAGAPSCRVTFSPELCASVEWLQGPGLRGESRLMLKFYNAQGAQIELLTKPSVFYDMEAMHHNIPPATVDAVGDAAFTVGLYFSMGGEWTITFSITIDAVVYTATYITKV